MKHSETQRDEQLSALLDSALNKDELDLYMQDLKRDPVADAEAAQRYRLIGDAMRDEIDPSSFMDMSAAISRAIAHEDSLQDSHTDAELQPVTQKTSFKLGNLLQAWFKPVAGVAVASSVAMLTLFTFNTVSEQSPASQSQLARIESATQITPANQLAPVNLQRMNPEIARNVHVASTTDVVAKSLQQQKQLNRYLLQHSGYASQSTMQGMMPYVRAADVKSREAE